MLVACSVCSAVGCHTAAVLCCAMPAPPGEQLLQDRAVMERVRGAQPVSASLHMVASVTHTKASGLQLGLASGLLPSAQCAVRHQITVESGNLCGSGRTWGIHPDLAEWQKMCFLATLEVSCFAYKREKDTDMKLLERKLGE